MVAPHSIIARDEEPTGGRDDHHAALWCAVIWQAWFDVFERKLVIGESRLRETPSRARARI